MKGKIFVVGMLMMLVLPTIAVAQDDVIIAPGNNETNIVMTEEDLNLIYVSLGTILQQVMMVNILLLCILFALIAIIFLLCRKRRKEAK